MPRDIPIIYSAPMVRALLADRKFMTRRLAWKSTPCFIGDNPVPPGHKLISTNFGSTPIPMSYPPSPWQKVKPGDRLWVRESFRPIHSAEPRRGANYMADAGRDDTKWKPAIHMPRWASRLTLIVTATKKERLQDISEADAIAEGIKRLDRSAFIGGGPLFGLDEGEGHDTARGAFNHLWRSLHGDGSWAENPEVVALSFRVIKANIDAPEARVA